MSLGNSHTSIGGKISIGATLFGVCLLVFGVVFDLPQSHVALASNATTSVTVLNTPPQWNSLYGDAQEGTGSSTSTPTNVLTDVTWISSATDSSNDNYYMLICKASSTPTPVNGGAPECGGGISNRWARSSATASGATSTVATTTTEGTGSQFSLEFNNWFAYICDGATLGAACNASMKSGSGTTSSPFVVNHRPTFTLFVNDSPTLPGGTVNWYATSSDPDTYQGAGTDTVKLFVCKAADFTGTVCGAGGTWATSVFATATPTSTAVLPNPDPDGTFAAYGYVIDAHGSLSASGGSQGTNRSLIVSNVTPTITAASISLLDTDGTGNLTLTGIATQTPGFSVQYTVTDQNSCQTASGTPEIIAGTINTYRSGITSAFCDKSQFYNANNCYPGGSATTTSVNWQLSCTASSTSCLGTGDSDVIWTCTFPLWYVADATDGTGASLTDPTFFAQNWLASTQAGDNNYATSSLVESSTGNELTSFLAYSVSTSTIAYGGLQPGQDTGTVGDTSLDRTNVLAAGNVGVDETLYGADMCPGFPAACSGLAASTIFVTNQHYATSGVAYAAGTALLANPGATFLVHVPKSTSTSTQQFMTTYWGIAVPSSITLSGDYLGQNTIIGVISQRAFW
jgi:hypothetical protein